MTNPNPVEGIELTEREYVRLMLLSGNFLVTDDIEIPEMPEDLPEGLSLPVEFPADTPTMAEWVDEERGEY